MPSRNVKALSSRQLPAGKVRPRPLQTWWNHVSDEELLRQRICDLPVDLETSPIRPSIEQLFRDLIHAGLLHFRPRIYVGDEWFTPEGVPAIAVPFYLINPRLTQLEVRFMRHAEGSTPDWCLRILRHEAGHCFDHAYRISKIGRWRQLFGKAKTTYNPDHYSFNPDSCDFVINLDGHYAQAHPDEDFAETFAVCINPESAWRVKYASWPKALDKLYYVDELIKTYGAQPPLVTRGRLMSEAARLQSTLQRFYKRRLKLHGLGESSGWPVSKP